jgi:hypothetical protein
MYSEKLSPNKENVLFAINKIYYRFNKSMQRYISNMSWKTERRFISEVCIYLEKGIILDYSDFEPGGNYKGFFGLFQE